MNVRIFFGWLLLAVGGLVAVLSGGCTLFFVIGNIRSSTDHGDLLIPLAVGGIPFVLGILAYHGGRWLLRRGRSAAAEKKDEP